MTVSRPISNKMAVTMALFWVSLILSVIGANAGGELSILHSPDSLIFSGSTKTGESLLKEIFSAALGLSVEENSEWKGLYVSNPFNTPEAVVEVYIDGVTTLGDSAVSDAVRFPLVVDEYEPDTYRVIEHRIKQRFNNAGNKLVNIKLNDIDDVTSENFIKVFGDVMPQTEVQPIASLKDNEEDKQFLNELQILKAITNKIESGAIKPDNIIDFYNLRFRTLHALSDLHGPNSQQTRDAKKLLGEALQALNKAFVKTYDGSVLVSVVSTDVAHTRRVRAAPQDAPAAAASAAPAPLAASEASPPEVRADNPTDGYSADYPAIFNIILWFGVVFVFTLIAIVYAVMDMDPGRDSIIYRMTSTRMKKDN